VTIVVGLATPDGLVLAADSRTTAFPDASSNRTRIASDSAEKVFLLCDRFAVATFDSAFIGERTIAGLMAEFIASLDGDVPDRGHDLAVKLGEFFHSRYAKERAAQGRPIVDGAEQSELGFIVAGYDGGGIGRFHEVSIPGPNVVELDVNTAEIGMLPRGQRDVIDRLLAGVDRDVLASLEVEIPADVEEALSLWATGSSSRSRFKTGSTSRASSSARRSTCSGSATAPTPSRSGSPGAADRPGSPSSERVTSSG
jgi:hypothetical protein